MSVLWHFSTGWWRNKRNKGCTPGLHICTTGRMCNFRIFLLLLWNSFHFFCGSGCCMDKVDYASMSRGTGEIFHSPGSRWFYVVVFPFSFQNKPLRKPCKQTIAQQKPLTYNTWGPHDSGWCFLPSAIWCPCCCRSGRSCQLDSDCS